MVQSVVCVVVSFAPCFDRERDSMERAADGGGAGELRAVMGVTAVRHFASFTFSAYFHLASRSVNLS